MFVSLYLLLVVVAFVLAVVVLIKSQGKGLIAWAVALLGAALLLGHGVVHWPGTSR